MISERQGGGWTAFGWCQYEVKRTPRYDDVQRIARLPKARSKHHGHDRGWHAPLTTCVWGLAYAVPPTFDT